jgi:anti-sigma factor RsiW
MSYKPNDATLVAYHYGELEGEELQKVEEYLRENPAERKRLQEWKDAREIMATLRDKEVIAPPIILGNNHRSFWQEGYVRMSLGIAASFLVLLVAAKMLGLSATYKSFDTCSQ